METQSRFTRPSTRASLERRSGKLPQGGRQGSKTTWRSSIHLREVHVRPSDSSSSHRFSADALPPLWLGRRQLRSTLTIMPGNKLEEAMASARPIFAKQQPAVAG